MVYCVKYKMNDCSEDPRTVYVCAKNKADAYDVATFEVIPEKEGCIPFSSWVYSVTYQNGHYRRFNTCEGLAY